MGAEEKMKNLLVPAYISAILTVIYVPIVTIWSEFDEGFKAGLAAITGHHWITKGVLLIVLYVVFFIIFYFINGPEGKLSKKLPIKMLNILLVLMVFIGLISIWSMYYLHYIHVI